MIAGLDEASLFVFLKALRQGHAVYLLLLSDMLNNEVQLWLFRINDFWPLETSQAGKNLMLFFEEQEELLDFESEKRQKEFSVSRGLLRMICSQIEGRPQEDISFYRAESGALYRSTSERNYSFNISHDDNHLLLSFSRTNCLGCDVQAEKPIKNIEAFVKKIAHQHEIELLDRVEEANKPSVLYRLWCLKEAAYKALLGKKGLKLSEIDCSDKESIWVFQKESQVRLNYHYRKMGSLHIAVVIDKPLKLKFIGVNK